MKVALEELKKIWKPTAFLTVLQVVVFFFLGMLDLPMIVGTALGTALAIGEFCAIGLLISTAIMRGPEHATRSMTAGYFFRLGIIAIGVFTAFKSPMINPLGFVLPLFYPKIAIYYNAITRKGESD